ncbi:MAG TPA: hypothetical protein VKA59_22830 [Vicinamibacterales bacterium]|nr:hypothetical protein [Vicinamibacterales bacterium]
MRIATAVVVLLLFFANHSGAQALRELRIEQPIRQSIASVDFNRIAPARAPAMAAQAPQDRERSIGHKIAGGAIGGVGGFFAGAYIGAAIDGDCGGCDDPGFKGFLIGAPIGAVVGAILGVKFF